MDRGPKVAIAQCASVAAADAAERKLAALTANGPPVVVDLTHFCKHCGCLARTHESHAEYDGTSLVGRHDFEAFTPEGGSDGNA